MCKSYLNHCGNTINRVFYMTEIKIIRAYECVFIFFGEQFVVGVVLSGNFNIKDRYIVFGFSINGKTNI